MGYLQGKTCYLTGPITAASDDGIVWRKTVTPSLEALGVIVDDPTVKTANGLGEVKADKQMFKDLLEQKKFKECKELFWPVCRKDLRSVDRSDFLVFYYNPLIPMFGTIDELVTASRLQKKPVLMMIEEENIKHMNPWSLVLIKEECIFTKWESLISYLATIDKY